MKQYVKLFEEFINESTTDGSIESLIQATRIAVKMGIFDEEFFGEMKSDVIHGVNGALRAEVTNIPPENKQEFMSFVEIIMKPIHQANTMRDMIDTLIKVSVIKQGVVKRLQLVESLNEALDFRVIFDTAKKALNTTKKKAMMWWEDHKESFLQEVINFLVNYILRFLAAVMSHILNTKITIPTYSNIKN